MTHHQPPRNRYRHEPLLYDDYNRPLSWVMPLENRHTQPEVEDCLAAAMRMDEAFRQNVRGGVRYAIPGGVAVAALTHQYTRALPKAGQALGEHAFRRQTKDVDVDLCTTDPIKLWKSIGGTVIGREIYGVLQPPGEYAPGRFALSGESKHIWESRAPWKGNVPFDLHNKSFRLDDLFRKGATFDHEFNAIRRVPILNGMGFSVGSINVFRGPLLVLLKLSAWPRSGDPRHKDLLDIRLLFESHKAHHELDRASNSSQGAVSRAESPREPSTLDLDDEPPREPSELDLDDANFKHFLDQLNPKAFKELFKKATELYKNQHFAKEVALWQLSDEDNRGDAAWAYEERGEEALEQRYRCSFEKLYDLFKTSRHYPVEHSLAKQLPSSPFWPQARRHFAAY
ncbi:hypothetical protein JCM5296_000822 [Sporobolomyces johnsonii]